MDADSVAVRDRLEGDVGVMKVDAAMDRLRQEIAQKTVRKTFGGTAGLGDRSSSHEY
jgi:hypothetical protein